MTEPNTQDHIDAIAAEWVARQGGGPLGDQERCALAAWLAASPAHRAAYRLAQTAWAKMGALRFAPGALVLDSARPPPAPPAMLAGAAWLRLRSGLVAALVCLTLVAGLAYLWSGNPLLLLAADSRTGSGEQRMVSLPDGSTVLLGPASAIAERYTGRERRVVLLAGIADFNVAPLQGAEQRPFVVQAAGGIAKALGTRFMVNRLPDTVEVAVADHRVLVGLQAAGSPEVVLSPGQSVRYSRSSLGKVQAMAVDLATAWQRGWLVFDHRPLAEVVAELNRYRHGRILITDAALAARNVSGVFDMTDPDAALATIARELGARTLSLPSLVTVLY